MSTDAQPLPLEHMATLGWLAASVGHDLQTPLAAIRANAELALRTIARIEQSAGDHDSGEPKRLLAALRDLEATNLEAARRLTEIVAGLRAYLRAESAPGGECTFADVLQQVLTLCALETRHVRLERDVPDDLPRLALAHARLMQVLMNLLLNAAHALKTGGTVRIRAERHGASEVRFCVMDDGPGLAPEVRERLFQLGITTRAHEGGTGLGLSIVQHIVDSNGGSIDVTSEAGRGTCISVRLPAAGSSAAG